MSLKNELIFGVTYIAVAKYSGILVQLLVTSILARLLVPEDFGIVAIATVIIAFFNILSDIGIGPAIVQNKKLSKIDLDNIFSFTVYTGLIMSATFFCLSYVIANYYNNEKLVPVCQLLAIPIVFHCASIVPLNIYYREKKFKFISQTALIVQTVSGVLSIGAALGGMGLYALIVSQIASSVLQFLIYYLSNRLRMNFLPRFFSFKKIMKFSIYQFFFNFINYFSRNLDKLLIGRYVGMTSLGYYEKSYRLMMMPLQNITFVIGPVMQPVFSVFQNDYNTLAKKYFKLLSFLAYVAFPLTVVIYFLADELILLFYGPQWIEAIPVFKILSFSIGIQIIVSTTGSIYQSANATKGLFVSGCWGAFFMVSSFIITLIFWGTTESVAWGYFIAMLANAIQCFYLLMRTLRQNSMSILKLFLRPLVISLFMLVVLYISFDVVHFDNLVLLFIVKLLLSLLVYLIAVQIMGEYKISMLVKILRNKYLHS